MKYKLIVKLAGDIGGLEKDMNELYKQGYVFLHMYESNARIIAVMEQAPKVGRPPKKANEQTA